MESILVVYDSAYGNTKIIAQVIGNSFDPNKDVQVTQIDRVNPAQIKNLDLLVVGSPTQRFKPTVGVTNFIKGLPKNALHGLPVAAFDTRLTENDIKKNRILAFFVRIFGYAARPIADQLKRKGGDLVLPPEGFYVEGMEGPLLAGERERAAEWAQRIESLVSG